MLSYQPLCYGAVTFVLYLTACAIPVVSSDDVDSKRPWDMLREGRGLQMLRLGKRDPSDPKDATPTFSLTDDELRQLVDILFGESRDPTRRQPPLPRYGRDLLARRELLDLLERFPNRSYMRPPPRAGRYRRSVADQDPFSRIRSVVRPRIGRYIHEVQLQTKAITRPRIGRELFLSDDVTAQNGGDAGAVMDMYQ